VGSAYLCPVCKANRKEFDLVYKLAQEIRKDPESGATLYRSDELVAMCREDGRPDIDVRCRLCGYVASETAFSRAARRDERSALRAF